jgi:dihydrolipoamide dehydrogenase
MLLILQIMVMKFPEVKVNLEKMIARKQAIVDQTTGGVKYLMDKTKLLFLKV